jgi:FKBP-type peptidyl-prolyl cis-trans isomerase
MIFDAKRKMIGNTMRNKIVVAVLLALAFVVVSCNPANKYAEEEKSLIADFVAANNITVAPDSHGLYYIETTPGTGEKIRTGDSVGVYYSMMLLSGKLVQTNVEATTPFRSRVSTDLLIEGWVIGLNQMKLGTKASLLMPSKLAYGTTGIYDYYYGVTILPGYTPLLYEIEVVELTRAKK